jgi:hypothetical protein
LRHSQWESADEDHERMDEITSWTAKHRLIDTGAVRTAVADVCSFAVVACLAGHVRPKRQQASSKV